MSTKYLERISSQLDEGVSKLEINSVKETSIVHYARAGRSFITIAIFNKFIFAKHGDKSFSIDIPEQGIEILFTEDPLYVAQEFVTSGVSSQKDQFYFMSDEWCQFLFVLKLIRRIYTKQGEAK